MEKTIEIDGRLIPFKSTGATPIRFKAQFRKDYFGEVMKLNLLEKIVAKQGDILTEEDYIKLNKSPNDEVTDEEYRLLGKRRGQEMTIEDYEAIDFDIFYNIAWVLAKTADKSIKDPFTWLDEFNEFPMIDIIPELQDMIISTIKSKKK
jgi:hypothetical protein